MKQQVEGGVVVERVEKVQIQGKSVVLDYTI